MSVERGEEKGLPGLTWRSLLLSAVLVVLGTLWETQASLVAHTCQVSEGTPSVPPLFALVSLSALSEALGRKFGLTGRELLVAYFVMWLSLFMPGPNGMRQLLPSLTSLRYFASPENHYGEFASLVPSWLASTNWEAVRGFHEGSIDGSVPWGAWAAPLLTWAGIVLLLALLLFALVSLFHKPWSEHEKLTFPLVDLAIGLAPEGGRGGARPLGSPLFWAGFGASAAFTLLNIGHAFNPGVPAPGPGFNFSQLLTERPWNALSPLYLSFRPEIVGLGYLVSLDVLFSVWFFYLLFRFENFLATAAGLSIPDFPFDGPQGAGAYLALAVLLVLGAGRHLARIVKGALRLEGGERHAGPLGARAVLLLLVLGFGALVAIFVAAGMKALHAVAFLVLIMSSALVYSRIRAQTGVPLSYCEPRKEATRPLFELACWLGRGGPRKPLVMLSFMRVINRMIFPQIAALGLEGTEMAKRTGMRRSDILWAFVIGVVASIVAGYLSHLLPSYSYGYNVLDGGVTEGGWRVRQALIEYDGLRRLVVDGNPPNWGAIAAYGAGFVQGAALWVLRRIFLRFPIHPLGLAIAGTFGFHVWFPLMLAWFLKLLVLRLGGPMLYRRLIPAFVGLAIGHFLVAGGIWGMVGAVSEDVARRYLVWFP